MQALTMRCPLKAAKAAFFFIMKNKDEVVHLHPSQRGAF